MSRKPSGQRGRRSPRHVSGRSFSGMERLEDRAMLAIAPLVADFPGIPQSFDPRFGLIAPPDPTAAVGPQTIVAAVNTEIAIYDKDGFLLDRTQLTESDGSVPFFAAVDDDSPTVSTNDPWVTFDTYSQRFFVLCFQVDDFTQQARFLIAVSTNSTPNDLDSQFGDTDNDWHVYSADSTFQFGAVRGWADYAKIAADQDSIYITANYFGFFSGFQGVVVSRIDKAPLLSGQGATIDQIPAPGAVTLIPVESSDRGVGDPMLFVDADRSLFTGQGRGIRVWELSSTNVLTRRAQITAPFDLANDAPQPRTNATLDVLDGRLLNAVYRAGSIWTAHTVADPDDGEANVRWYEIASLGGTFQLRQTGDVDPGLNIHTFMPAINANYRGDMALTYTQVSIGTTAPTQFASMMYTTRLVADAPGVTEPGVEIRAGSGSYEFFRWGDYAGLALDPVDQETFYAFHEVAVDEFTWQTWFGVFRYADSVVSSGFGRVVTQSPSGVTTAEPQWVALEFNRAMLTNSFDLADILSFTGPGGIVLPVSDFVLSFEWVNDFALRVLLRPLPEDGIYTMTFAPTIFTAQTGSPLDQDGDGQGGEPGQDNYTAQFELDLAEIIGFKYNDRNGNGRQDGGEETLPGWTIYLDTNENGQFDSQIEIVQENPGIGIPQPNPSPVPLLSTTFVTGLASQLADLNVALDISHTFDRDVTVELTSPNGVKITLFSGVGLDEDNFFGTVLDDEANVPIDQGAAPFTGRFQPQQPLSRFDGIDPNGFWTLTVTDNSPGDGGTLDRWSLEISASEPSQVTDANGNYAFKNLPGGDYRVAEVQQAGWIQTDPSLPGLKITELDLNFPDFIEIQNLTDNPINTAGWFVAVSGEPFGGDNINVVSPFVWNLPSSISAGDILYRSDSPSSNYIGGNIFWNEQNDRFGSGWAMIVDNFGRVIDWVGWGFTQAEMAGFDVNIQVTPSRVVNITPIQLRAAWQGTSLFLNPPVDPSTIKRVGNTDSNRSSDFVLTPFSSVGGNNQGLITPLPDADRNSRTIILSPGEELTSVNFGNQFVGPAPTPTNVENLGGIDWITRAGVSAVAQPKWYRFAAEQDGLLTLQGVSVQAGSSLELAIYDLSMNPLGTARGTAQPARLDVTARAGQEFYLGVTNSAGTVDLTWANLVRSSGDRLDVTGTDAADALSVQFAGSNVQLTVNGLAYAVPLAGLNTINIDAGAGQNTLRLGDTAGDDSLEVRTNSATLTTPAFTLRATRFAEITAAALAGFDKAFVYDSTGDDTLTTTASAVELVGPGFKHTLSGFDRSRAYAAGGFDRAFLNDTAGDETATLRSDVVDQQGSTFQNFAHTFDRVRVYGGRGFDRAFVYDTSGDETLNASPTVVQMTGTDFDNFAHGFDRVRAFATGGFDRAFLNDSTGSDDLFLYENRTEFKGANYDNIVYGFDRLRAFAGQGFDRAFLYDSAGNDDVSLYPKRSELKGVGYDNIVYDFERVRAFAGAGFDRAYVYDTTGDDTLNVRGTSVQLTGAGYDNWAEQFDNVRIFASTGMDRLNVADTVEDDVLTTTATAVRVRSRLFDVTATNFDSGTFAAGTGNDTAELLDTTGDDLVEVLAAQAILTNSQFTWTLNGYKKVRVCSVSGGTDRMRTGAVDFVLEQEGPWLQI